MWPWLIIAALGFWVYRNTKTKGHHPAQFAWDRGFRWVVTFPNSAPSGIGVETREQALAEFNGLPLRLNDKLELWDKQTPLAPIATRIQT